MTTIRLTSHQREVLGRIQRLSRGGGRWAHERHIGSHGACWHLVNKGYVDVREVAGPRGGTSYEYKSKEVTS